MKIFIFIFVMIGLFSCKSTEHQSKSDSTENIATKQEQFFELVEGTNAGFSVATNKVITSEESFSEFWLKAYANYMNKPELPQVDFNEYQVILVAMGTKNSGGYTIKVDNIQNMNNHLEVEVLMVSPGENCVTTEALTSPFQFVQVKKYNGEVNFISNKQVIDCK